MERGTRKAKLSTKDIMCPRCGRMMTPILSRDAGWLRMVDHGNGYEDGNEVLAYSCMHDDCLEGRLPKAA